METQPLFEGQMTKLGGSQYLLVPAWILKAFKIEKDDELIVRIEKVKKASENRMPIVWANHGMSQTLLLHYGDNQRVTA